MAGVQGGELLFHVVTWHSEATVSSGNLVPSAFVAPRCLASHVIGRYLVPQKFCSSFQLPKSAPDKNMDQS